MKSVKMYSPNHGEKIVLPNGQVLYPDRSGAVSVDSQFVGPAIAAGLTVAESRDSNASMGGNMIPLPNYDLQVRAGSPLDLFSARTTAKPAGSRGRIRVSPSDTTQFEEMGNPGVPVKIMNAQWAPDASEIPLPMDRDLITDGVEHLARCGFNAIRVHGLEYWLMSGTGADFEFPADRLDMFDWFMAECKRVGLYWILNPRQPELYQAGPNRFSMPSTAKNMKAAIMTEQWARDHWERGFDELYNRVNPYTGENILQDKALFLVEAFNEASGPQTAAVAWPANWGITRQATQGTAAKTWQEWLADSSQAHGYASLSAMNTSWGTAYASFPVVPSPSGTELPTLTLATTQRGVDVLLYVRYLDRHLGDFFRSMMTKYKCSALLSSCITFPNLAQAATIMGNNGDDVFNLHNYTFLSTTPAVSAVLGGNNAPCTDFPSWLISAGAYTFANKPAYAGEFGWPFWGIFRNQYPLLAAFGALNGLAGISLFHQGDFFAKRYEYAAKPRTRVLFPYSGAGDPVVAFTQTVMFFLFQRGDVSKAAYTKTLLYSDRYYGANTTGTSPRTASRLFRAYFNLFSPTIYSAHLHRIQLAWDPTFTDDALAVENTKTWADLCAEALAASAIPADNASYVSTQANNGTITAVETTGTIGSVVASVTQPVLTLSGSNTLTDRDYLAIPNITGSGGTWPGGNGRSTRCTIKQTGVANKVQILTGLNLTGLTGFTSGTWCEHDNVVQSGNKELYLSRREGIGAVNTSKSKYFVDWAGVATYPVSTPFTFFVVESCTAGAALFATALDGQDLRASSMILLSLIGNVMNSGYTLTAPANTTLATVGSTGYPILQDVVAAVLTFTRTTEGRYELVALDHDGSELATYPVGYVGTTQIRVKLDVELHGANSWVLRRLEG